MKRHLKDCEEEEQVFYLTVLSVATVLWHCQSVNELRIWNISGMIVLREKQSLQRKILSQCHFVCHKFHMDWPRIVKEI